MAHPRQTRDVTDPAFPHGTPKGYRRGCRAECCRTAFIRWEKRSDAIKEGRIPPRATTPVPVQPLLDHVAHLRSLGHSVEGIATAAGIIPESLCSVIRNNVGKVRKGIADAVLATTPEDVESAAFRIPAKRMVQQVRSMQALGWPLSWISEQLGLKRLQVTTLDPDRRVTRAFAERVAALAAEVGDRRPDPERDGIPRRISLGAATWARKSGYDVPAAYDDEGNLIPDASAVADASTHTRSREENSTDRLLVARGLIDGDSDTEIAWAASVDVRTVERTIYDLGLIRERRSGRWMPVDEERADAVRAVLEDPAEMTARQRWRKLLRVAERGARDRAA